MKCSECGAENPERASYCKECGNELETEKDTSKGKSSSRKQKTRKHDLPVAAVDRIIRKAGSRRVSEDAASELADILEERGQEITREAIKWAEYADRKTIRDDDIQKAAENL